MRLSSRARAASAVLVSSSALLAIFAASCVARDEATTRVATGTASSSLASQEIFIGDDAAGPPHSGYGQGMAYGAGKYAALWSWEGSLYVSLLEPSTAAPMTTTPVLVASPTGDAGSPLFWSSIAFDGTSFRVFWSDASRGAIDTLAVSPSGVVLGAKTKVAPDGAFRAACAPAGQCMVLFREPSGPLLAVRVDAAGTPLDASPLTVAAPAARWTLSYEGGDFVARWFEHPAGSFTDSLMSRRIGLDGSLQAATHLVDEPSGARDLVVAAGPTQAIVAWGKGTFVRVQSDGTLLDTTARESALFREQTIVAASASGFVVASNGLARYIDTSGTLGALTELTADPLGDIVFPDAIASDGASFVVLARNYRHQVALRLDGAGLETHGPSAIAFVPGEPHQASPTAAWAGGAALAAWVDGRFGQERPRLHAARVTATGDVLDAPSIALVTGEACRMPSLASNGTSYLLTYTVEGAGGSEVRALPVSSAGTPTGQPLVVASASPQVRGTGVIASIPGGDFLVTWAQVEGTSGVTILAARVSAAGARIDTTPVVLATRATRHHFARWTGSHYVVGYDEREDIKAVWLTADLQRVSGPTAVGRGRGAVADCDPNGCLVAWSLYTGSHGIRRFSPGGAALGAALPLAFDPSSLIWDGKGYVALERPTATNELRAHWLGTSGARWNVPSDDIAPGSRPGGLAAASDGAGHTLVALDDSLERLRGVVLTNQGAPDAGPGDAAADARADGPADGGARDAEAGDAPAADASMDDAAAVDAARGDARADAAVPASPRDAAAPDADVLPPGYPDAGFAFSVNPNGCSCRAAAGGSESTGAAAFAVAASLLAVRRRRRARARGALSSGLQGLDSAE